MPSETRSTRLKELVKAHYDAAVNQQDLSKLDEQLTPDFLDHGMPPGTPRGPDPAKEFLARLKEAFPDLSVVSDDVVAEGDRVAVRATWTGTHLGEFRGIPPSGREIRFEGAVFWRFEGDRIAERWPFLDVSGLMKQLVDGDARRGEGAI